MELKRIKLKRIKPYPGNPRVNEAAVRVVKASIEQFGYQSPIVVDRQNVIIAGHTRFAALQELGWTEAEVLVADLPEQLAREFRIIDNRTSELAHWDRDRLADELRAIEATADLEPFFRAGELARIMAQAAGMAVQMPSQAQIDQAAEEAALKMERLADESEARLTPVTCRGCGRTFHIR